MSTGAAKNEAKLPEKPQPEAVAEAAFPFPPEIANQIPEAVRAQIVSFATMRTGSPPNPILSKITSDHITQVLSLAEKSRGNDATAATSVRRYQFTCFLIIVAVFIFLLVFFKSQPTVFGPMLSAGLGFAAGFGIGKKSK